ncbi:MAG: transketolase C-terminal domain-containing protein [Clostridia bacterium]|nr:transketolase C-terminal domain-containing protein [Clostridia bacterium]
MTDELEMRQVYCAKLIELSKADENIVVLEADLMSANGTKNFFKEVPEKAFNVGIAEANMIGVAAGMATFGKIPFAATFAPFATRRCYDQIAISVAYSKLPVKIVGTDPGVCAEVNGGTHMSFEDMGIMRGICDMVCFEPTDATMMSKAMKQIAYNGKPTYVRLFRKKAEKVFDDSLDFQLGKAIEIKDGKDVTLFASGIMVDRAIKASELLASDGISAKVVNIHTWKPIDEEAIISSAKATGAVVVCENHSIRNGLSSAVSEVLVQNFPVPAEFVGINERFGEVGKNAYLSEKFGITTEDIVKAAKKAVSRKG